MNKLYKLLNFNENNAKRNSMIWNVIASSAYSFQSAILLLIITRVAGLAVAGVFSIAYSVSQMFSSIGSFSMREYQVSDTKNEFSFDLYMTSKFLTVAIMIVLNIVYSLFHGYAGEKLIILLILTIYRCTDVFDDGFHGEVQKRGRLDIASRVVAARIIISSTVFMIVFIATKDSIISSLAMTIVAVVISLACNYSIIKNMKVTFGFEFNRMFVLLLKVLPVCMGAFLYNYIVNSPKYAIDNILTPEMQTVFNIIFMPTFVINMFSFFIFKPYVLDMGVYWNDGKRKEFIKLIARISLIIIGMTLVVVVGGALLGIPVLQLVYGVDIQEYRVLLILLLGLGGIAALNSFGTVIVTVIRRQMFILVAYAIALGVNLLSMNAIVEKQGLMGAGYVYGIGMSIVFVVYIFVIVFSLLRSKENK